MFTVSDYVLMLLGAYMLVGMLLVVRDLNVANLEAPHVTTLRRVVVVCHVVLFNWHRSILRRINSLHIDPGRSGYKLNGQRVPSDFC